MMKNVIITGADGFVGSYTVKKFLKEGINVLALDIKEYPENLEKSNNLRYVQCDVSDVQMLQNTISNDVYDTFIHFAWMGSAGTARTDYNLQMKNALDTVECMKIAKQKGCVRFVCAGSIMEYEVEAAIHSQGSRPGMGYLYGMGKHIAHCMCKSIAADIGIELIWPMITNTYGVGEISPRFVNSTLRKIINEEPLQFTMATQNYDFVYITDVADAFFLIAQNGKPFHEYMIGSGNARPLREYIKEIHQSLAPEAEIFFGDIPFSGINMPIDVFQIEDTMLDTGFCPKISFLEGIQKTLQWIKDTEKEKSMQ